MRPGTQQLGRSPTARSEWPVHEGVSDDIGYWVTAEQTSGWEKQAVANDCTFGPN
jgi:hypothetical protein